MTAWLLGAGVLALLAGATLLGVRAVQPLPDGGPSALTPMASPGMPAGLETRSLTVATVSGALPLSGTDANGQPAGLHVQVAQAVCETLGLPCRFALTAPDRLIDGLDSGAVDLIAADLSITAARAARVRFAPPHARTASILVGRAGSWPDDSMATDPMDPTDPMEHMGGRLLAVAAGSDQAMALRQLAPAGAGLLLAEHHAAALDALHRGEVDAALVPLAVGLAAVDREAPSASPLRLLGPPVVRAGAGGAVALATAPGDDDLAAAVAAALDHLRRNGRLAALARTIPDPLVLVPPPGWLPLPDSLPPPVIGPGESS